MASKDENKKKPVVEPRIIKSTSDLQRLRLEKLMKNPDKPVIIPDRPKQKQMPSAPDFVRNVMGSSAGAGSGEFHVYRHLRRKEYARQKFIQEKSEQEKLDDEYKMKLEENRKKAEEKTAKKRAKRLKKKKSGKIKLKKPKTEQTASEAESDSDKSDEEKKIQEQSVHSDCDKKTIENSKEKSEDSGSDS